MWLITRYYVLIVVVYLSVVVVGVTSFSVDNSCLCGGGGGGGGSRRVPKSKDQSSTSLSCRKKEKKGRWKPIPYIATVSTVEHGKALSQFLKPNDRVLELGTQMDECTRIICNRVSSAVLVDVTRTESKSGRSSQGSRDPNRILQQRNNSTKNDVTYVELDNFAQYRSVLEEDDLSFDVMVIDTSAMLGNDLTFQSLSIILQFVNDAEQKRNHHPRPRCVIVKSKSIHSLSRRLIHSQRLFDGTTTVADLKNQKKRRDGKPYIIAGVGVEEYRRTIPYVVQKGDACIEVGCFSGTTTQLVHTAATTATTTTMKDDDDSFDSHHNNKKGFCIGVDIGPKIIDRARNDHSDICFEVGDAWRSLDLLRMKQQQQQKMENNAILDSHNHETQHDPSIFYGYDVIYVDIGGLSGPDGVLDSLSLINGLGYALEPRCIVIKSLCMKRLAASLRPYSQLISKDMDKHKK